MVNKTIYHCHMAIRKCCGIGKKFTALLKCTCQFLLVESEHQEEMICVIYVLYQYCICVVSMVIKEAGELDASPVVINIL